MSLDLNKLEDVREEGNGIIARCPACAERGNDRAGNHLIIWPDGRFGCVVYPGDEGVDHRKRIFALAGKNSDKRKRKRRRKVTTDSGTCRPFVSNVPPKPPGPAFLGMTFGLDASGRLGRLQSNAPSAESC